MIEIYVVFAISVNNEHVFPPEVLSNVSETCMHTYISHAHSKPKKSQILERKTDKTNNSDKLFAKIATTIERNYAGTHFT